MRNRLARWALAALLLLSAGAVEARRPPEPRSSLALDTGWSFRQVGREDFYPARVPGVVHLDLLENEIISEPFYADNEAHLQWIGKTDWEYRTEFDVPAQWLERKHVELLFEGLDTYAEVSLNGERILDADNMYRWWRVPVGEMLRERGNELAVVLRSPIVQDLEKVEKLGYELPASNDKAEGTSPYTRKAPYSFGWDWGPRFVTAGIWKPVRLEAWDDVRLTDVFVRQVELGGEKALLEADVEIVAGAKARGTVQVDLEVEGTLAASAELPLATGKRVHTIAFEIADPELWWPNGLGEQPLYFVSTSLVRKGVVVDERSTRIGLRTIELRRDPDEWGKSFEFVVNGVPVFAKGANWIPADSFLPRVGRERYEGLLRSAQRANMNMLRVWAGGIYESDDFYELADEMGLLIWQDFHFSTSLYPADDAFLESVAVEAEHAIRRLRNHASLALWCGNNEVETAWNFWGWKKRLPQWLFKDYEKLFHDLLPRVVARHDATRPYWPSSPSANGEAPPGSPDNGDMHYWGVWHGAEPFSKFEQVPTRFMSEYGFQSFPELATIRSFAPDDQLALDSPVMSSHQKHPRGNQLIREYMLRDYDEPKDFASFLYVSQVLQAEGMRIAAEYHRRSRPRTMGTLYWQFNDCWPVASWSGIDYFGRWKALQYYAKRFFSNVLVSTAETDGRIDVFVVSDLREPLAGTLSVKLLDFEGRVLWSEAQEIDVQPLASRREFSVSRAELLAGRPTDAVFLHVSLGSPSGSGTETLSSSNRFFLPPKDLALGSPGITAEVVGAEAGFEVRLAGDRVARSVRLSHPADAGFFADNFFDLIPGIPVTVAYELEGELDLEAFRASLVVESIVDAFDAFDTGAAGAPDGGKAAALEGGGSPSPGAVP